MVMTACAGFYCSCRLIAMIAKGGASLVTCQPASQLLCKQVFHHTNTYQGTLLSCHLEQQVGWHTCIADCC